VTDWAVSLGAVLRRAGIVAATYAALGALLAVLTAPGAAEAHGTVLLITSERTGAYALTVEKAPGRLQPGPLELTILVEHVNAGGAVADAQVTVGVALVGRDATPTTVVAVHDTIRPAVYVAVVPLHGPGEWHLTFRVTGSLGSGTVGATVRVADSDRRRSPSVMLEGVATGGVLIWAGWLLWRLTQRTRATPDTVGDCMVGESLVIARTRSRRRPRRRVLDRSGTSRDSQYMPRRKRRARTCRLWTAPAATTTMRRVRAFVCRARLADIGRRVGAARRAARRREQ
jgi:hypothetical protein